MTATGWGTAATEVLPAGTGEPANTGLTKRGSDRGRFARWAILLVAAVYFIGPLLAAFLFTVQNKNVDAHGKAVGGWTVKPYTDIFAKPATGQESFQTAIRISLLLSVLTIVLTLALLVPTMLLIHLKYPRVRTVVEMLTLLPLVFPPIVLVVGVSDVLGWSKDNVHGSVLSFINNDLLSSDIPLILVFLYVMLAMPFVFRTLDAGIRSIDSRTLVEAARNLGAGWGTVLFRVLIPSLRTALVNSAFLCFALVMGEYTIAQILLFKPFPVWLATLPTTSGQVQVATSVLSLVLVEALLLLIGSLNGRRVTSQKG